MGDKTVREAVGVFHDEKALRDAADELMTAGFDRSDLSLLAGDHAVEQKLGHAYTKVEELEDDAEVPSVAYSGSDSRPEAEGAVVGGLAYVGAVSTVGVIVASGGTVAAAIVGAVIAGGIGSAIGVALAKVIGDHHAGNLKDHLEKGGLLLWVRTKDGDHETRACDILKKNGGEDVHVHDLPEATFKVKGGISHDTSFMNRLGL
ncbi:MAG: hypothetical protein AAF495_26890 [Pseudomonadota bacterium]